MLPYDKLNQFATLAAGEKPVEAVASFVLSGRGTSSSSTCRVPVPEEVD
jgi:hypothetical protein